MTFLTDEEFSNVIKNTPLVAFDMLITYKNKYLVGKRVNEPAGGYLFNPGGRIRKGESIENACKRLTLIELGSEISLDQFEFYMNTQHMYDNNMFNNEFGTHYVCLCYIHELTDEEYNSLNMEDQHEEIYWLTEKELLNHPLVHSNSKAYLY